MRKKSLVVLGLVLGLMSLSLTGCTSSVNIPDTVKVESVDSNKNFISVYASSEIKVSTDIANIGLGVESLKPTALEAERDASAKIDAITAKLIDIGVEESKISTSNYSIYPSYNWRNDERYIEGYNVYILLSINGVNIDMVGDILTESVREGANTVNGVTYECSTYDEVYAEALSKAINLAKSKADKMAEASGSTVDDVISISESYQNTNYRYADSSMYDMALNSSFAAKEESANFNFMPGEIEIKAEVTVNYSIK